MQIRDSSPSAANIVQSSIIMENNNNDKDNNNNSDGHRTPPRSRAVAFSMTGLKMLELEVPAVQQLTTMANGNSNGDWNESGTTTGTTNTNISTSTSSTNTNTKVSPVDYDDDEIYVEPPVTPQYPPKSKSSSSPRREANFFLEPSPHSPRQQHHQQQRADVTKTSSSLNNNTTKNKKSPKKKSKLFSLLSSPTYKSKKQQQNHSPSSSLSPQPPQPPKRKSLPMSLQEELKRVSSSRRHLEEENTTGTTNTNSRRSMVAVEDIDSYLIELELGKGAMRFTSNPGEPTFEQQIQSLSKSQREIYESLKLRWDNTRHIRIAKRQARQDKKLKKKRMKRNGGSGAVRRSDNNNNNSDPALTYDNNAANTTTPTIMEYNCALDDLPDYMYLRFCRFTATTSKLVTGHGGHNKHHHNHDSKLQFHEERTWKAMKKYNLQYCNLTARKMEHQLLTKTLFPVPGLQTKVGGYDMFYMRPSRYIPNETSTKVIIDNLTYVIHTMLKRSCHADTNGIGFLAYMNDWNMKNFDIDYCLQFMLCLQGYIIPVKVQLFLIVNPPSWFDVIWKIMKSMLVPNFRKKVKMISEKELPKYLQTDYLNYLPDDMNHGTVNTTDLVNDYISYQSYMDEQNPDWKDGISPYSEMFTTTTQKHGEGGDGDDDTQYGGGGYSTSSGDDYGWSSSNDSSGDSSDDDDDYSTLTPPPGTSSSGGGGTGPFAWARNFHFKN